MKKAFSFILVLLLTFAFVTASQAFECPTAIKAAQESLAKAEGAAGGAAASVKEQVDKDIAAAKELLKKGEDLHTNAQGLQDHASAVKALYESIAASKEAFYLASKVK